jgi:hypothetical protein
LNFYDFATIFYGFLNLETISDNLKNRENHRKTNPANRTFSARRPATMCGEEENGGWSSVLSKKIEDEGGEGVGLIGVTAGRGSSEGAAPGASGAQWRWQGAHAVTLQVAAR